MRDNLEAARELVAALNGIGLPALTIDDLVNVGVPYPEAIPLLLAHVQRPYRADVKEAIVRALAVPYAGPEAFDIVLKEARRSRGEPKLLYAFGLALALIATRDHARELAAVASDPSFGEGRIEPLLRLADWKLPDAIEIARQFLREQYFEAIAIQALRKLKSWDDAATVKKHVTSGMPAVRDEAKKFLKALEKVRK